MILAIDPGNSESGYALIDSDTYRPVEVGNIGNHELIRLIESSYYDRFAIEMVASYGMAVGAEVFETCVWIGRFQQQSLRTHPRAGCDLIKRLEVKTHHCHNSRANDANIRQALMDRFGDKGTKANPGWFYGFAGDMWAAYALAVLVADTRPLVPVQPVLEAAL